MRRYLNSPRWMRRFAWVLILGGAVLSAGAVALRDRFARGDDLHDASYLLTTLAFLLAVAGAVLEARVGGIFLAFAPRPARRRAILETVLGIAACLAGCVALGGVESEGGGTLVRPLLGGLLIGGLSAGLAGLFTLGWFYGLDWAAGRMERLDQTGVEEARRRGERGR